MLIMGPSRRHRSLAGHSSNFVCTGPDPGQVKIATFCTVVRGPWSVIGSVQRRVIFIVAVWLNIIATIIIISISISSNIVLISLLCIHNCITFMATNLGSGSGGGVGVPPGGFCPACRAVAAGGPAPARRRSRCLRP